jgi:hypothetical protein
MLAKILCIHLLIQVRDLLSSFLPLCVYGIATTAGPTRSLLINE